MEDLNAIRDTPIGDSSCGDRFIWPTTKNERYSVKTGYHWLQSRLPFPPWQNFAYSRVIQSHLWKLIWKLQTPTKIRHFLWRSLHGALPTMAALYQRYSTPNPICFIGHNQVESIEHLFLQCPWVEAIWFGGILNLCINRYEVSN